MVELNNCYSGLNTAVIDSYLRNLHDYRISIELSLLPIFNHLLYMSEKEKHSKFILPSKYLIKEKKFLSLLGQRYHKRKYGLIFECQNNEEDLVYNYLGKLLNKCKKSISYCLNDLVDLFHKEPAISEEMLVHKNIIYASVIATAEYYKKIPEKMKIEKKFPQLVESETPFFPISKKFDSNFQLYAFILSDIKREGVDFEILKLYDFLLESGVKKIESSAMLEIYEEVKRIGEEEYGKIPININVEPTENPSEQDIMLEEWSSNLRRALELKFDIGKDFVKYLNEIRDQRPNEFMFYIEGCYPELKELVNFVFRSLGQKVPEDLR